MDASLLLLVIANMAHCDAVEWGHPLHQVFCITLQAGIDGLLTGLMAGGGIGLFMIGSWIMMNNACGNRPFRLTRVDCGHATMGCAIIGVILILVLF
ncbi:MAG: hypothetical protein CSA74_10195 [Rhodobacterales bacterium]|nr:MAG: hypothetical protein CSA74_10195 [Rhodobacterales bacterium]